MGTGLILHIKRQRLRGVNNLPKDAPPLCGPAGLWLGISPSPAAHTLNHQGSQTFLALKHSQRAERMGNRKLMLSQYCDYCKFNDRNPRLVLWEHKGGMNYIILKSSPVITIRNPSAKPWQGCRFPVVTGTWFSLCIAFWKGEEMHTQWISWGHLKGISRQPNFVQSVPPWGHVRVLTAT